MRVSEVFHSLQGEGLHANEPMVFVRLAGCNLIPQHCLYCDTAYAQNPDTGEEWKIEEVVKRVSELSPYYRTWVAITGGEPLWQRNEVEALVRKLKPEGSRITIETNGSFTPPRWWTLVDSWNADIKCPCSGVCGVSKEEWFSLRKQDQIKFVVQTTDDLKFVKEVISRHREDSPIVELSPVFSISEEGIPDRQWLQEVWKFCLENRVRLSLQQHKIVFGNKRGV